MNKKEIQYIFGKDKKEELTAIDLLLAILQTNSNILYYMKKLLPNDYSESPKMDDLAINIIQQLPDLLPITEHDLYARYLNEHKEKGYPTLPVSKRSFNKLIKQIFEDEYTLKNTTRGGHQTRLWITSEF